MFFTKVQNKEFDFSKVKALKIIGRSLKLTLKAEDSLLSSSSLKGDEKKCRLGITSNDSQDYLQIVVESENLSSCSLGIGLQKNFNGTIEISIDTGSVESVGLSNNHVFQLTSGDVTIKGNDIENINGGIYAGRFQGSGFVGSTSIDVASGEIEIGYRSIPKTGSIRAHLLAGNITISLPQNARIQIKDYPNSQITSALKSDSTSEFILDLLTQKGAVKIGKSN